MHALVLVAVLLALATPAFAQVDIRATPPPSDRQDLITPGPYREITEPRENQWYGHDGVRVPYDPAFIEPLSKEHETTTSRGRYGVAGWTPQELPVGPSGLMHRENPGWLSFGFSFTWGAPVRPAATPRPAPATRPAPAPGR